MRRTALALAVAALAAPTALPASSSGHAFQGRDSHGALHDVGPSPVIAAGYPDYAPHGVPDFSQCRPEWSLPPARPGAPGQWTHAGPVALANALWWLDSRAEPEPVPPPGVSDGHALVTAYPAFGRKPDDHSPDTLAALVQDLAVRSGTNTFVDGQATRGTRWDMLVEATRSYIVRRGLEAHYEIVAAREPDAALLAGLAGDDAGAVLLLGVWVPAADGWARTGGHYVALAGAEKVDLELDGVSPDARAPAAGAAGPHVWLADPLADKAAHGADGTARPPGADRHSCRTAPREHDDAALVSHDRYRLASTSTAGPPGNRLVLEGYFDRASAGEAAAFEGQNGDPSVTAGPTPDPDGVPLMAVDAVLAVRPLGALAAGRITPAATSLPGAPSATLPPASATPRPRSPTPTPSPSPTVARLSTAGSPPTSVASPTWSATPEAPATATSSVATPGRGPGSGPPIEGHSAWLPLVVSTTLSR